MEMSLKQEEGQSRRAEGVLEINWRKDVFWDLSNIYFCKYAMHTYKYIYLFNAYSQIFYMHQSSLQCDWTVLTNSAKKAIES